MASPEPRAADVDDVILYMDELPTSNGHGLHHQHQQRPLDGPLTASSITALDAGRRTPTSRLLETDNVNIERPPLHGPEIDDLEPELLPALLPGRRGEPYPGIDDGLLEIDDDERPTSLAPPSPRQRPGSFPGFFAGSDPATPPDMNVYQQKKTIAQGMMDLALISANANQFRYVLQSSGQHPFYYPSLAMIGLSLFLQVVVGIGLIWNSRYNVKHDDQMCKANRANNWTVIAIFLVTILNVFISSFGVVEAAGAFAPAAPAS